ncbi:hypothetical protein [Sinomicrobium sp. M5D2P17]
MAKTGSGLSGREYDMPVRRQRQVYFYREAAHPEIAGISGLRRQFLNSQKAISLPAGTHGL